MAETIPEERAFVAPEDVATEIVELIKEHLPGGIYVDKGDSPNDIVLISRGQETAGIFLITVHPAELKVVGD